MLEIRKTNWGVANTFHEGKKTIIELNEKLYEPEFKGLLDKTLKHESEHHHASGFWENRKVDALTDLSFKDLIPFYKKYPKTFFQQMSPISYREGTVYLEWSLIFLYSIYIGIGFGIFGLIKLFSFDSVFFWKIVKNIAWLLPSILLVLWLLNKLKNQANKEAKEHSD